MGNLAEDRNGSYTYEDYLSWDGPERYELINGYAYLLAAPSTQHQRISGRLFNAIFEFLKGRPGEVFASPFDVRLFPPEQEQKKRHLRIFRKEVVVQPDLAVVCNKDQLDEKGCNGAPALAVEILSPSNRHYQQKINEYIAAGVREIWLIDPQMQTLFLYLYAGEQYTVRTLYPPDILKSPTFPGLEVNLDDIFPNETNEGRI